MAKYTELEEIFHDLAAFQESTEQLILASRVIYDAKYHAHVMQQSNEISRKIIKSQIAESDKIVLLLSLNNLFQQAVIEIKV